SGEFGGARSGRGFGLLVLAHALLTLVALAIAGGPNVLFFMVFVSALLGTGTLFHLFQDKPFFAASFSTLTAVYASVFAYFLDDLFGKVSTAATGVGFALPIACFAFACWWQRDIVRAAIARTDVSDEMEFRRSALWLLPVALVGAAVGGLSLVSESVDSDFVFLVAMGTIGAIVMWSSRRVAIFLVEVALLFEEFTQRISNLILPTFAFLTVYAVLVIAFAAIYTQLSRLGTVQHFSVDGVARALTYPEALYFSVVTLSTVGYGDVLPVSSLARALASFEVVSGVLLLLFGFSELISYAREHADDEWRNDDRD
ncbi:MAG: potassium channel family protein, partial [Hyphomicrobiaceae bacterium]|nr:two pore domain potassium channel family protein [Hyphomicrobiaceae bacterium]